MDTALYKCLLLLLLLLLINVSVLKDKLFKVGMGYQHIKAREENKISEGNNLTFV